MLSTSEEFIHTMWSLYAAQVSALNQFANAAVEAGMHAAEAGADAMRGARATTIVLARQWQLQANPSLINLGH